MTHVPADGPSPCDLMVVGESPGATEVQEGRGFVGRSGRVLWRQDAADIGLIETLLGRTRETVRVSNVCKEPLPEPQWKALAAAERERYASELLAEVDTVGPNLVLAFGTRAASILVPGFRTMTADHGVPAVGPTGKWVAMALWHPAAYLRGNTEALGIIANDLLKAEMLLTTAGLVELMRPAPALSTEWPAEIGFLRFEGPRKSGRCLLCGSTKEIASYAGEGLTWKLCKQHAAISAMWAQTNLPALREHADIAVVDSAVAKWDRTAARMQAELQEGSERLLSRRGPVGGASDGIPSAGALLPHEPGTTPAPLGGSDPERESCADGASARHIGTDAPTLDT